MPCGTHVGVRTTFVANAEDVIITTIRKPQSIEAAVAFFTPRGKVDSKYPIPSWHVALDRLGQSAIQRVKDNRLPQVDNYIKQCGIEEASVTASCTYAKWSAAAEYRLLAAQGIKVGEISLDDLEPFLGRGRLPVLIEMPLAQLNKTKVDVVDKLAWSLGVDDAYGHDRYTMTAAVLKQIFTRASTGKPRASHE